MVNTRSGSGADV